MWTLEARCRKSNTGFLPFFRKAFNKYVYLMWINRQQKNRANFSGIGIKMTVVTDMK